MLACAAPLSDAQEREGDVARAEPGSKELAVSGDLTTAERPTGPVRDRRWAMALMLAALMGTLTGCGIDSYFDQSVVGRWETTPTVAPILERIDLIEHDEGEFVETTSVMPEDLVPEVSDYRVGPGDTISLQIFDFLEAGVPTPFERQIDPRGAIDLPQLGRIDVYDLTADDIRQKLRVELREQGIIEDALVSVQVIGRRQATFSVYGAVPGVGRYLVPVPDYRLLEALSEAGGLSPVIKTIYVIRQAALTDEYSRGLGARPRPEPGGDAPAPQNRGGETREGVELDDLIRRLSEPEDNPAMMQSGDQQGGDQTGIQAENQTGNGAEPPPIDLIEAETPRRERDRRGDAERAAREPGSWMFLNDRWVRVEEGGGDAGIQEGEDPLDQAARDLVAQRIIEIPAEKLTEGDPRYNIVVRPGDVIRVPTPESGLVYLAGPGIARPGIYSLPTNGRLTLTKAVLAAGGLNGLAVPWRVDLTRMVDTDRQATIRLDLKAIAEGTQPDIFLKPDDMVNVGTSFWATPLAVVRGGLRASYGFGFLLDRNFGNDVFGAPPNNRGFN